jgi:hypothetical protein
MPENRKASQACIENLQTAGETIPGNGRDLRSTLSDSSGVATIP